MELISAALPYVQITLSILLITTILFQQTGSGVGGALGGDNFSATNQTRRGAEKFFFYASIVLGALFAVSAFIALLIHQ